MTLPKPVLLQRSDAILAAICLEIDQRRAELDADSGLGSVSFIVVLNSRSGRPQKVIYRSESLRDLTATGTLHTTRT